LNRSGAHLGDFFKIIILFAYSRNNTRFRDISGIIQCWGREPRSLNIGVEEPEIRWNLAWPQSATRCRRRVPRVGQVRVRESEWPAGLASGRRVRVRNPEMCVSGFSTPSSAGLVEKVRP
jgi:hypothetical protein